MTKQKNPTSNCLFVNKKFTLSIIIAVLLTISIMFAAVTASQYSKQTDFLHAPVGIASANDQFQVQVAYGYVGPAPSSVTAYFDQALNMTTRLKSQYPGVIRLNIKDNPGIQIAGCDAIVQAYDIKVATDLGPVEHYAYFVGTNYNPSFSKTAQATLIQCVPDLVNVSRYSTIAGNFNSDWNTSAPLLTNTIGSITSYTSASSSSLGLFNAGRPNAVTVTVYRIGYMTMTDGSVSIFEDQSNSTVQDIVQLSNYKSGFLYNDLMPSDQLPQENLFQPIASP